MIQKENLEPDKKKGLWGLVDRIEGDKVVWIIVFMLIMISWLAIFSSTPLLALETGSDRLSIMKDQVKVTIGGLFIMWLLYKTQKIGLFLWCSKLGFFLSLGLLSILVFNLDLGIIKAESLNSATRSLKIFGVQFHVYEVVKVAMVMYLSWAIHMCKMDEEDKTKRKVFPLLYKLSLRPHLAFLRGGLWKRFMYIYIPMGLTTVMVAKGSNSSAMIIGGVMTAILIFGGIKLKEIGTLLAIAIVGVGLFLGVYMLKSDKSDSTQERTESVASAEKVESRNRISTFIGRLTRDNDPEQLLELKGQKKQDLLDKISQPNAAKIAVHEGGILGKGPGGSTQKYVVPVMFGDYMFSFLLEEYGLWGGIIVIILYVSLLARGSWIARLCDSDFSQLAVCGLTLLISAQAFLHMFINVDLGPLTGQTLPLVSHGKGAFLSFCVAFGIILSISRMANKKIREEEAKWEQESEKKDDIQANMDVLDQLDSME
jgi:cell division protein FtsW